jgi:cytochrome P450
MTQTVDEFTYDPFSWEAMTNPLPLYEVLRDRYPVYYAEQYDAFFLSRFADAWEFLAQTDNTFVSNEGSVFAPDVLRKHNQGPLQDPPSTPLLSHLNYGSPMYEDIRQAHGRPLRPGSVRKLEPFIRSIARRRLDDLVPRGRFDLTQEYGGIVSASTICHLLHIDLDKAKDLLDSVNALTRTDNDTHGMLNAEERQRKLLDFVVPQVAARRREGADGSWPLVDGMLDFRLDGRPLDDTEIARNLTCVLVGGTETLPKVVAHGLMELWRHPGQLAQVRQDLPANCALAIEEMNRFCGPAQWFGRTCRKETTVAGQRVRPGQRVIYLAQSANRDPREFDHPDEFRWNRPIPRTLAFGFGQHFCIGVHVARLEGRIMLEEFLGRVTDYEIDLENAVRLPSSFQWGYNVMPAVIKQTALSSRVPGQPPATEKYPYPK